LEELQNGDRLYLQTGDYPTVEHRPYVITKSCKLYGGYVGEEGTPGAFNATSTIAPTNEWTPSRLVVVTGNVEVYLERLEFRDGDAVFDFDDPYGGHGAAIYITGGASVSTYNSTFRNNKSNYGGAVYVGANSTFSTQGSSTERYAVHFENNTALRGGAIYNDAGAGGGASSFHKTRFYQNSASQSGGAIVHYGGDLTLSETTFESNSANETGGAIAHHAGQLRVLGSIFEKNTALQRGGAIYLSGKGSTLSGVTADEGSLFRYNHVGGSSTVTPFAYGGAIYAGVIGGEIDITAANIRLDLLRATFTENVASVVSPISGTTLPALSKGGAVFVEPCVTLRLSSSDSLSLYNNYVAEWDTFGFGLAQNIYPPDYTWQLAFSSENIPGKEPVRKQAFVYDIRRDDYFSFHRESFTNYFLDSLVVTHHTLPTVTVDTVYPTSHVYILFPTSDLSMQLPVSRNQPFIGRYIYVTPHGDGVRDGSSWGSAATLPGAVEQAVEGDTLLLRVGTYYPSSPLEIIDKSLTIRGGFLHNGSDRDPNSEATAISGEGKYRTLRITTGEGSPRKVTLDGLSLMDGMMRSNPWVNPKNDSAYGGGNLLIEKSHVTLNNCHIRKGTVLFPRVGYDEWIVPCGGGIAVIRSGQLTMGAATIADNQVIEEGNHDSDFEDWHDWKVPLTPNGWYRNYGPALYIEEGGTLTCTDPFKLLIYNNGNKVHLIGSGTPGIDKYNVRDLTGVLTPDTSFYAVTTSDGFGHDPLPFTPTTIVQDHVLQIGERYAVPMGYPFRFRPTYSTGVLLSPHCFIGPSFWDVISYTGDPDSVGTMVDVLPLPNAEKPGNPLEVNITYEGHDPPYTNRYYALPEGINVPEDYKKYADGRRPSLALPLQDLVGKLQPGNTVLLAPMSYRLPTIDLQGVNGDKFKLTFEGNGYEVPKALSGDRKGGNEQTILLPWEESDGALSAVPMVNIKQGGELKASHLTFRGARAYLSGGGTTKGGGALYIGNGGVADLDSVYFEDNVALDMTRVPETLKAGETLQNPRGGAVYADKGSTLKTNDVTFAHNAALFIRAEDSTKIKEGHVAAGRDTAYGGGLYIHPDGNTHFTVQGRLTIIGNRAVRYYEEASNRPAVRGYGGGISFGTPTDVNQLTMQSLTVKYKPSFPDFDDLLFAENIADTCTNIHPNDGPTHTVTLSYPSDANLRGVSPSQPYGSNYEVRDGDYFLLGHAGLPEKSVYVVDSTTLAELKGDTLKYAVNRRTTLSLSQYKAAISTTKSYQGVTSEARFSLSIKGLYPLKADAQKFKWTALDEGVLLSPRSAKEGGDQLDLITGVEVGESRIKVDYGGLSDTVSVIVEAGADPLTSWKASNFFPIYIDETKYPRISPYVIEDLRPRETPTSGHTGSSRTKADTLRIRTDAAVSSLYRLNSYGEDYYMHVSFLSPYSEYTDYEYRYTLLFSTGEGAEYDIILTNALPEEGKDDYGKYYSFPADGTWHDVDIPLSNHRELIDLYPKRGGGAIASGTAILTIINQEETPIAVLGAADETKSANFAELYYYTREVTPTKLAFVACQEGGASRAVVEGAFNGGFVVSSEAGDVSLYTVEAYPRELIFPVSKEAEWSRSGASGLAHFHVDTYAAYTSEVTTGKEGPKVYVTLSGRAISETGTLSMLHLTDYGLSTTLYNKGTYSSTGYASDRRSLEGSSVYAYVMDDGTLSSFTTLGGGGVSSDLRAIEREDYEVRLDRSFASRPIWGRPNSYGQAEGYVSFVTTEGVGPSLATFRRSAGNTGVVPLGGIDELGSSGGALHIALRTEQAEGTYEVTFTVSDGVGGLRHKTLSFGNLLNGEYRLPYFDYPRDGGWHSYSLPIREAFGDFFKESYLPEGETPYLSISGGTLGGVEVEIDALFFYKPAETNVTGLEMICRIGDGEAPIKGGGPWIELPEGEEAWLRVRTLPASSFGRVNYAVTGDEGCIRFDRESGRIEASSQGVAHIRCYVESGGRTIEKVAQVIVKPYDPEGLAKRIEGLDGLETSEAGYKEEVLLRVMPRIPGTVKDISHKWGYKVTRGEASESNQTVLRAVGARGDSVEVQGFTPGTEVEVWDSVTLGAGSTSRKYRYGPYRIKVKPFTGNMRISSTLSGRSEDRYPLANYETFFYIGLRFSNAEAQAEALSSGVEWDGNQEVKELIEVGGDPYGDPLAFKVTPVYGDTSVRVGFQVRNSEVKGSYSFRVGGMPSRSIKVRDAGGQESVTMSCGAEIELHAEEDKANRRGVEWRTEPEEGIAIREVPGKWDTVRRVQVEAVGREYRVIARPRYSTGKEVSDTFKIKVDSLRYGNIAVEERGGVKGGILERDSIVRYGVKTEPEYGCSGGIKWELKPEEFAEFVDGRGQGIGTTIAEGIEVRIRAKRPMRSGTEVTLRATAIAGIGGQGLPSVTKTLKMGESYPDSLRVGDGKGNKWGEYRGGDTVCVKARLWPSDVSDRKVEWSVEEGAEELERVSEKGNDTVAYYRLRETARGGGRYKISGRFRTWGTLPEALRRDSYEVRVGAVSCRELEMPGGEAHMKVGEEKTVEAWIRPVSVSERGVTWSIWPNEAGHASAEFTGEGDTIVSYDEDAVIIRRKVKALRVTNRVRLSISAVDGSGETRSAEFRIDGRKVERIEIENTDGGTSWETLQYGESYSRGLRVRIEPTDATNQAVNWRISPAGAGYFAGGEGHERRVGALRSGSTFYVIASSEEAGVKEDSVKLNVPAIQAVGVTVHKEGEAEVLVEALNPGDTSSLEAELIESGPYALTTRAVEWSIEPEGGAVFVEGRASDLRRRVALSGGAKWGEAVIIQVHTIDGSDLSASYRIEPTLIPYGLTVHDGRGVDSTSMELIVGVDTVLYGRLSSGNGPGFTASSEEWSVVPEGGVEFGDVGEVIEGEVPLKKRVRLTSVAGVGDTVRVGLKVGSSEGGIVSGQYILIVSGGFPDRIEGAVKGVEEFAVRSGVITIRGMAGGEVRLYTSTGREVSRFKVIGGEYMRAVPRATGIYVAVIRSAGEVRVHRFLVH
jgi:predicted outer membrane repeat protein